jgi:O-antigen/teichoic acid export membrane protein
LIVCGFAILRLWVGPEYAANSLRYLRILVLANIIRNLCAPYATIITATGRQAAALAAAISEAAVNLGSSIYLAHSFGAIGVAVGTLIGSFVGVGLHFAISMPFTRNTLMISRSKLFLRGLLRPAVIGIPTAVLIPFWWSSPTKPGLELGVIWAISTFLLAWFLGIGSNERRYLIHLFRNFPMAFSGAMGSQG